MINLNVLKKHSKTNDYNAGVPERPKGQENKKVLPNLSPAKGKPGMKSCGLVPSRVQIPSPALFRQCMTKYVAVFATLHKYFCSKKIGEIE